MIRAKDSLSETLRRTLMVQAVLTLVAALIAHQMRGLEFALALVYGGVVTIAGTWVHAWRLLKIAEPEVENDATQVGAEIFKGAILKLVVIMGLLAIGMGYFKLDPLAVLVGFIVAYVGFVFARGYAPRSPRR